MPSDLKQWTFPCPLEGMLEKSRPHFNQLKQQEQILRTKLVNQTWPISELVRMGNVGVLP